MFGKSQRVHAQFCGTAHMLFRLLEAVAIAVGGMRVE